MRRRKSKLIRYYKVFRRNLKRLTRKRVLRWLKSNLKGHPFILGALIFIWINALFNNRVILPEGMAGRVTFHISIIGVWFLLVVLSNLLKDVSRVKWYLRKRFVFFMLFFFAPLGIILLWSGSKFKKRTKTVFTLIFSIAFLLSNAYYNRQFDKIRSRTFFEDIIATVTKPKKQIYIKRFDLSEGTGIQVSRLSGKRHELSVSDIASRSLSSVVSIKTYDKKGNVIGQGSGFVISEDGIIVTNFHVLESSYSAEVKIGDKLFEEVGFIKGSPDLDIALLKVDAKDLEVLPLGDSDALVDGQFIVVLSNPWGLERSVSDGLVSAMRSLDSMKLIQMTAPISPGSSGGPVLNAYGEVVGITTIASFLIAQNLNFAIPINYLSDIIVE